MILKSKIQPKWFYIKYTLPGFVGHTIPPFGIFIKKGNEKNSKLHKHELQHWRQFQRMGVLMFYFRYFIQLIIIGYNTMPMELECKNAEIENDQ